MKRPGCNRRNLIVMVTLSVASLIGAACEQAKEQAKKAEPLLPPAMEKAVRDSFPDAELAKLEVDEEAGIRIYDLEFKADKGEMEVAADGTVMEISTIVQMNDLPRPAADAIQKAAADAQAEIKKVERSETRAEVGKEAEKGKIVQLSPPKYVYEVELSKEGKTGEMEIAPDGQIVEPLKW